MVKPREANSTLKLIDEYCHYYRNLFSEVRSFEAFTHLHAGIISDIKRKTLPAIAEIMGLENAQGLHHFLTQSPWEAQALRRQRLELILKIVKDRKIVLIIDETGDPKKGKATDYVARQYLGRLGKVDNGIVAVVSYGLIDGLTFPLKFEIYKPKERLKLNDSYRSKPQIASQMIRDIKAMGFEIDYVLADSLYGESTSTFIRCLQGLNLQFAVAIRSNHGVRLPPEQRVRANKWRKFERIFADGSRELRYIREIIYGKKRELRYWEITTDIETLPGNSTWYVMTQIPGVLAKEVGNLYGNRTWIEYGFRQSKSELGWADFRVTQYPQIEKWWEIVCSAYLMITLYTRSNTAVNSRTSSPSTSSAKNCPILHRFEQHQDWDEKKSWKSHLNNLRLILQPLISLNLVQQWLKVFPIPQLSTGLARLRALMNFYPNPFSHLMNQSEFLFYSA